MAKGTGILILALVFFISVYSMVYIGGFEQKRQEVHRVLLEQYQISAETVEWSAWGCGQDDPFTFRWTSHKDDKAVSGYDCSGFLKGTTIRFN